MRKRKPAVWSVLDDFDTFRVDDKDGDTSSDSDVCERCGKIRKDHGDEDHEFEEE